MSWLSIWAWLFIVVWSEIFLLLFLASLWALKKKFIPASDVESAILVAKRIQEQGFTPVINLLGEHDHDRENVERTYRQYLHLIDRLHEEGIKGKISIKPTQLGLAISRELYRDYIFGLSRRAHRQSIPPEIDIEGLQYLDDTLGVFMEIPGEFLVRQAVQAYLKRSQEDIGKLIGLYKKVRLVKGAYAEGDLNKSETRRQMENLAEQLLIRGNEPAIATISDKDLIGFLTNFHCKNKIEKDKFIFQMLYGISDEMKELLRDLGFRIEIYVPVGSLYKAPPYLWRRMKELMKILF